MALVKMNFASGGGGTLNYKSYTTSSFTISGGATKTITINDMQGYSCTLGVVTWNAAFGFFHAPAFGDMTWRTTTTSWTPSESTFLEVTTSGNQIFIKNRSSSTATVYNLNIQYY